MEYGYSATHKTFYLLNDKEAYEAGNTWCDDIIPVSNDVWAEYSGNPPQGKTLGVKGSGHPCWVDAPAPTQDEQIKKIESEREALMMIADREIQRLKNVGCVYSLSDTEATSLSDWQRYLADLYRMEYSDIKDVCWPERPPHKK